VSGGEQVLICPACQGEDGWQAELDRCPSCDGVRLSKTLGVLRCGGCGWVGEASVAPGAATPADRGLAADVNAALGRLFGAAEAGTEQGTGQ
jgi:hypothetical protein